MCIYICNPASSFLAVTPCKLLKFLSFFSKQLDTVKAAQCQIYILLKIH